MAAPDYGVDDAILNDKDALRRKAAASYQQAAGLASQGAEQMAGKQAGVLSGYDQALQSGQRDIRSQAAQGLAAGAFGAGRSGHAGYGAGLQAGVSSGLAQGQLGAQVAKERGAADYGMTEGVADARTQAAQLQAQGYEAIGKMGTNSENQAAKQAQYDSRIYEIEKANKGWAGIGNDDEDNAARQVEDLANFESDPSIKAYLMNRAARIRSKAEDF